jgi:hypothetical protein
MEDFMWEAVDCRLILVKFEDFFCKMTRKWSIYAVRLADPTAGNGGRRGHVPWPQFGAWIGVAAYGQ